MAELEAGGRRDRLFGVATQSGAHGEAENGTHVLSLGEVNRLSFPVTEAHVVTVHRVQFQEGGTPL